MSRVVRQIDAELVSRWNQSLQRKTSIEGLKDGKVIESFSFELFPGEEPYTAEFKLVNGSDESGPYLDIVLWNDGQEVFTADPCQEKIDDEFFVRDSFANKEFMISLTANEKYG